MRLGDSRVLESWGFPLPVSLPSPRDSLTTSKFLLLEAVHCSWTHRKEHACVAFNHSILMLTTRRLRNPVALSIMSRADDTCRKLSIQVVIQIDRDQLSQLRILHIVWLSVVFFLATISKVFDRDLIIDLHNVSAPPLMRSKTTYQRHVCFYICKIMIRLQESLFRAPCGAVVPVSNTHLWGPSIGSRGSRRPTGPGAFLLPKSAVWCQA